MQRDIAHYFEIMVWKDVPVHQIFCESKDVLEWSFTKYFVKHKQHSDYLFNGHHLSLMVLMIRLTNFEWYVGLKFGILSVVVTLHFLMQSAPQAEWRHHLHHDLIPVHFS
jgi:hypothetical protein